MYPNFTKIERKRPINLMKVFCFESNSSPCMKIPKTKALPCNRLNLQLDFIIWAVYLDLKDIVRHNHFFLFYKNFNLEKIFCKIVCHQIYPNFSQWHWGKYIKYLNSDLFAKDFYLFRNLDSKQCWPNYRHLR
jgi:hypothetical protein